MANQKLSNEFMDKILTDATWKNLSENFKWTEQTLEKNKDKVDWKLISENSDIFWTPSMLEKFKKRLDWKDLSSRSSQTLLNVANLERFKDYWDWSELSNNSDLELSFELIDKFIDLWDWSKLIDRYDGYNSIYSFDFLEKYIDRIPTDKLQNSLLWKRLTDIRVFEVAYEIMS